MGALSYCDRSISRSRTCSISVGLKGAVLASLLGVSGCGSFEANVAAGVVGSTLFGGQSPTHEIEQIYYLGTFDPREQLPPTIYRIRVHGQASVISGTKFASGWVPAAVIDALNTHVGFDVNDPASVAAKITPGEAKLQEQIKTGRRLVQFGPEGFREAPANHRLVIVMGASPQSFFKAIDMSLGMLGQARAQRNDQALKSEILEALLTVSGHQRRLDDLSDDVEIVLLRSGDVAGAAGGKDKKQTETPAASKESVVTPGSETTVIAPEGSTVIKQETKPVVVKDGKVVTPDTSTTKVEPPDGASQ